jgi:uncharacterized membrane protein YjgN (DUF898 family)
MEPLIYILLAITLALASICGLYLKSITEEEMQSGKRYFNAFFWIFAILAGLFLPLILQIAYYLGVFVLLVIEHSHKKHKEHNQKKNNTNYPSPRKILILTSPLFLTIESSLFLVLVHMIYTTQIQGTHNFKLYLKFGREHWLFFVFALIKMTSLFVV